jgi:hypothetical protein
VVLDVVVVVFTVDFVVLDDVAVVVLVGFVVVVGVVCALDDD